MCGIAGFFLSGSEKQQGQIGAKLAADLALALSHRGPDGEGIWRKGAMGLVHRRLSIIDVEGGAQPLFVGKDVAGVVNGEIYNYKDLHAKAKAEGAKLATKSDSEPPLHRYAQIGFEAMLAEMRGMYALGIADTSSQTMHLAVDPFGIKPLYYAETGFGFVFASEPRALVRSGLIRAEVNENALGGLLNRHYSTGAETLFKGVYRLLPGEHLTVKEGRIVARGRRAPGLAAPRADERRREAVVADFAEKFTAAVGRHLVADVPFGLLLSGGLDSSAILCAMKELGAPICAYTAKIEVGEVNEADGAAALCKKLGATHVTVPYGASDFWPALVEMAWAMDDLTTDYAALPLLKLTKRARQDVKILLSGEGGDEMLGGYSQYRKKRGLLWKWKVRRSGDATPQTNLFTRPKLVKLPEAPVQPWSTKGFSELQLRQGQDAAGWLANDLLLKLDRTTMVHGIEGRVPFLDDDFAAYAFGLPDTWKVRDGYGKYILRAHLDALGHGEMAWARKQGFSVAVGVFLNDGKDVLRRLWRQSETVQGLLRPEGCEALLARLDHPKTANLVFSLTLLALWEMMHVQGMSKDAAMEAVA